MTHKELIRSAFEELTTAADIKEQIGTVFTARDLMLLIMGKYGERISESEIATELVKYPDVSFTFTRTA